MSEQRWVQHISGQGEKWAIKEQTCDPDEVWFVECSEWNLWLPKSEYRLCDPPEGWVDVTEECEADDYTNHYGRFISIVHKRTRNVLAQPTDHLPGVFRLRKVHLWGHEGFPPVEHWAFIVERKEP